MHATADRSLRGWRAAVLLAVGAAVGVAIAAGPAASRALWGAHRLKPDTQTRAYAFVRPFVSTGFDAARSRGFTALRHPATGVYCLVPQAGLDIAGRSAVASPEWTYSAGGQADVDVFVAFGTSPCTTGELGVVTTRGGTTSDDIAFTVVVS